MNNIPGVKVALVAVSRDCFPVALSQTRRGKVAEACRKLGLAVVEIKATVENERDALAALDEVRASGANALCVYLGNFGPEGPETILAQRFGGPVMFAAAAEESQADLMNGRGDAYCGMLNASYNLGLRRLRAYIPEYPVGIPEEVAAMVRDFVPVARALLGLSRLKIFGFGPRPFDFLACNAPIKALYDIGVEIQENSELDLYEHYRKLDGDSRIAAIQKDMEKELGGGNKMPGILPRLAQYELALTTWMERNLGASDYGIFANKCWPAFQTTFKFVPCYVNGRLAARGVPVACETDIYGALSEYLGSCVTDLPATLLDINNTVPYDMVESSKGIVGKYAPRDLFMGFHCGNTAASCMKAPEMKYQLIMKRALEPQGEPDITRGTLEGQIKAGQVTVFRLQSWADTSLRAYVAEGEVLDIDPKSFGSIGVFAVPEMARFYRHVLVGKRYPHHAAIAFARAGKALFDLFKLLGVEDIAWNRPASLPYEGENPFKGC
jgi:L-fucose isomerase-like protein